MRSQYPVLLFQCKKHHALVLHIKFTSSVFFVDVLITCGKKAFRCFYFTTWHCVGDILGKRVRKLGYSGTILNSQTSCQYVPEEKLFQKPSFITFRAENNVVELNAEQQQQKRLKWPQELRNYSHFFFSFLSSLAKKQIKTN